MKRQRSRGRKPGGGGHHHHGANQPNRTLESNGPDIKVRGPAAHIYERYLQLARDASSAGDRVTAENYLQHAEHYFRMLRAMQPTAPPPQASADRYGDQDFEGEDEGAPEGESVEAEAGEGEQPDIDFPGAQQPQQQQQRGQGGGGYEGDGEGASRRRRGRRSRYRAEGDREGGEAAAGEPRENGDERPPAEARGDRPERSERPERERGERQERGERRERPQREGAERESAEGFSNGPRPAFLGSD